MKINILILNILILCVLSCGMPVFAQEKIQEKKQIYTYCVKKEQAEDVKDLNVFLARYLYDLNAHNVEKIGSYYALNYISGDGFSKNQVLDLVKQTWVKYPDLKYSTSIKNLRLQNTRASIEFIEEVTGTTKDKSDITKDNGCLKGISHNILYLEKFGSGWAIVTDKTLYEDAVIKYGIGKNIDVSLQTPEQVLAGEEYAASLKIDLPLDVFAIGSITSVPIVYPPKTAKETFRQIPASLAVIERVLKANKDCNNEIVSASTSFCQIEKSYYTSLDLKVAGIAIVLKRVNVLPERKL